MHRPPRESPAGPGTAAPREGLPAVARARRLASGLLIAVGCCLVAVALAARLASLQGSAAGLDEFRRAQSELAAVAPPTWTAIVPDRSLWAEKRVAAYEESLAADLGLPLAVLRIPRLALEVPVWTGVDELTLNRGVGRIPGTALPGAAGNSGLAGHRDGFFRVLREIGVGDEVVVETLGGVARYAVTETLVVDPAEVWVLAPTTEPSLTLVTCYPFYFVGKAPRRFIVRASAVGDPAVAPAADGDTAATPVSGAAVPNAGRPVVGRP